MVVLFSPKFLNCLVCLLTQALGLAISWLFFNVNVWKPSEQITGRLQNVTEGCLQYQVVAKII